MRQTTFGKKWKIEIQKSMSESGTYVVKENTTTQAKVSRWKHQKCY